MSMDKTGGPAGNLVSLLRDLSNNFVIADGVMRPDVEKVRLAAAARIEALEHRVRETVGALNAVYSLAFDWPEHPAQKDARAQSIADVSYKAIVGGAALSGTTPPADGLVERLLVASEKFLASYLRAAHSGDWGNWDVEREVEVVALREAIMANRAHRGDKGVKDEG